MKSRAPSDHFFANEFPHFFDLWGELGAGGPIGGHQFIHIESEGLAATKNGKIKISRIYDTKLNRFFVGPAFGGGKGVEESGKRFSIHLADVLNGAHRPVSAMGDFAGVEIGSGEEVRVGDLPLPDLIEVGGCDPASGGAAGFFLEDVGAVVFPGEIEQAMDQVGNHGAFVDGETLDDLVALVFKRSGFPPDLPWVCHHT